MALIEITDNIKRLLDEKNYVIGIFIDFKKALDTVDHEILLRKLDCYGIRGHANMFFRSYLTNRRQFTIANGVQSDIDIVECGVPQGSVLGPLFFLLYINDIYRGLGCNAVRLFADDTSLLSSGRNLNDIIIQSKELFHMLYHWCVANKLSINSDKTNFVLIHMKNKPVPNDLTALKQTTWRYGRLRLLIIWVLSLMKICTGMRMLILSVLHCWNTLAYLTISNRLLLHVLLDNCTLHLSIPALIMALKYMAIVLTNTWVNCKLYKTNF